MSQQALLHIDYSEAHAIGEASEEAAFQLPVWKNFAFWNAESIDRNVAASLSKCEEKAPLGLPREDWLVRRNIFVDDWGNVIKFPSVTRRRYPGAISISTMEEWECLVSDVSSDMVFADSKPLIENVGSKVQMEIPLREFSRKDRAHIKPGMVFRYLMCWTEKASGTRSRESFVYVRRPLRSPTRRKLQSDAVDNALRLLESAGEED